MRTTPLSKKYGQQAQPEEKTKFSGPWVPSTCQPYLRIDVDPPRQPAEVVNISIPDIADAVA